MSETINPNRKLLVTQIKEAQYVRRDFVVTPAPGTTMQEMLVPMYWAHVARDLRPFDRIEVRAADGKWWAELIVRVVEPLAVKVELLRHRDFEAAQGRTGPELEVPEGYEIKHRGLGKWCAIRLEDQEVVIKGQEDKLAAIVALHASLARLAA